MVMNATARSSSETDSLTPAQWIPHVRHLLAAIDLTDGDDAIIEAANELIKNHPEIALTLLTVIPEEYLTVGDFGVVPDPMISVRKNVATEALEKLRTRLPAGVQVEILVSEGRPADEICRIAKELKTNFILMTSHGRTGVKLLMMGSTAEEVVHNAPCSVLVLKPKAGKNSLPLRIGRIGVAYDESESSRAALALGLQFMRHSVSHLDLISAVEPITLLAPEMAIVSDRERLEEAQVRLNQVCRDISSSLPIEINLRLGKPWRVVKEIAEERECDLLIIGAHEYWRPGDWILGTTAEKVVRHTACPVLIVRPARS
ncbi:MAG: hypothetical protein RL693_477 [Verrucomicrobiota bacterium]|jgi:nucleotide-binding universal stress UspA family protein